MYFIKTPNYLKKIFPDCLWNEESDDKVIYLTFDDGPIPESTPFILETLRRYNAKATFFCVGHNIEKHNDLFALTKREGHSIGSHTFNHLSGWQTPNKHYYKNVDKGAKVAESILFRPPYGRITPKQIKHLSKKYTIVMWDILSGDFDLKLDADQCLENVINHATNGSIIVFHDNLKSIQKLKIVLPKVLQYYTEKGFTFVAIQQTKPCSLVL